MGAYDVEVVDIDGDGRLDLIFPSAWVEPPQRRQAHARCRCSSNRPPRQFIDATERYGLMGVASLSLAAGDLNGNGRLDLVVGNYYEEYDVDTVSFVYWGTEDGFDAANPLRLPTPRRATGASGRSER